MLVWGRGADEGYLKENTCVINGPYGESFLATITVLTEETPESKAFVAEPGYFISKGRKSCSDWDRESCCSLPHWQHIKNLWHFCKIKRKLWKIYRSLKSAPHHSVAGKTAERMRRHGGEMCHNQDETNSSDMFLSSDKTKTISFEADVTWS